MELKHMLFFKTVGEFFSIAVCNIINTSVFSSFAIFTFYGHTFITNSQYDQLQGCLIAQFVEHCAGIADVMGSNPVQA